MLWHDHRTLAARLRDQGLADCLVAHFCLREDEFPLLGRRITLAHVVVAKAQQSVEKVTKGWLLWQFGSFDPTKGHAPFTRELEFPEHRKLFGRLLISLNRLNKRIVREIKWLESLAPRQPDVPEDLRGYHQPLTIIPANTEYPYWSATHNQLLTSAEGLSIHSHGVRAFKAVRTFLEAMARSGPTEFTGPIQEFLEEQRLSTEIAPSA